MYVSQIAAIHKTRNTDLMAALASLPHYEDCAGALVRAATAFRTRDTTGRHLTREQVIASVAEQLEAGEDVPLDLGPRVVEADLAAAARTAELEALEAVEILVGQHLDQLVIDGVDATFSSLDQRLRSIVTEGRDLDLGGATSAETAITTGKHKQWTELIRLRSDYVTARKAQELVMTVLVADYALTSILPRFGFLQNFPVVVPDWFNRQRGVGSQYLMDGSRNTELDPFPADHEERFAWLVEHPDADPWVPSGTQLRESYAAAVFEAKGAEITPEERARSEAREQRFQADLANARRVKTYS